MKKTILRFLCQDTQNNVKCSEKWFRKSDRMCVCACVCVRVCVQYNAD